MKLFPVQCNVVRAYFLNKNIEWFRIYSYTYPTSISKFMNLNYQREFTIAFFVMENLVVIDMHKTRKNTRLPMTLIERSRQVKIYR